MRIDKHTGMLQVKNLDTMAKEQAKLLEKLATGKSLNRASDDAAGMAMAMEFDQQVRGYRNAEENVYAGMSALSIADGSISSITDMLQRQRELALQSSNDTLNGDQRADIDREFQSLSQEIDRVAKSSQFNGQNLLDGSSKLSDGTGQVNTGSADAGQNITLPPSDLTLSGLNMSGQGVASGGSAVNALDAIDAALRRVSDNRSSQGAVQNRMEHALQNISSAMINTTQGLSSIEDLDYAKATTDLVRTNILQDAATAALSQFNNLSRSHLLALLQ
jgi:flagellin